MWKITNSLTKLENKIKTRKDRKLALKEAKTEYKKLVLAIKKSQNPADFLNADDNTPKQEAKQEATKTEKVKTMGSTIFFKASKFDFQKVEKILDLEIEEYQSFGMKKHGDIGIKAKGKSDDLAKKVNQKKRALKKYGLHLEPFEKSLNKGAVIN